MDPQVLAIGALAGAVLLLWGVVALIHQFRSHGREQAEREAARGAAELAAERNQRIAAESLASERLGLLQRLAQRELDRARGASIDAAFAHELDAARAGAADDDALADGVLELLDPGGAPPAAPARPVPPAGDGRGPAPLEG